MGKKEGTLPEKSALNYVRFVKKKIVHVIVKNVEKANMNAHVRKLVKIATNSSHFVNVARKIQKLNLM